MSENLYLSRLLLDPRSRRVRAELANPHELHRTIMSAFPDGAVEAGERVLYRLDPIRGDVALMLLVQSTCEPAWGFLDGEPRARGYLASGHGENPAVKAFRPQFAAGQVLAFRLRANPTVKRGGKRLGLYREEEQREWLRRKGEAGGFTPVEVHVRQEDMLQGTLRRSGAEHKLQFLSVRFEGYLQVRDAEKLAKATAAGIGSGKGFGFGLLSLARAG